MKAICIDNSHRESDLTLNKVYDVEYIPMCKNMPLNRNSKPGYNPCYGLLTDNFEYRPLERSRFITLQKVRDNKLKSIGV